jgi:hypothetical protein
MAAEPGDTPVTTPLAPTVATELLALVHAPPLASLVKVTVPPGQIAVGPLMLLVVGAAITVIALEATSIPQLLDTK